MHFINVVQGCNQLRVLVNMAMSPRVPWNVENLLTTWKLSASSSSSLLQSHLLLLSTALQLLVQSFDLLNHILLSSSILDKGLPIWHFDLCISFLTSSPQGIFGLPIGLFEMGFQECIALTILVSCILSIWPYHPNLCALATYRVI